MDIVKAPEWFRNLFPEGARNFGGTYGWYAVLIVVGLLLLLLLWAVLTRLLRRPPEKPTRQSFEEILNDYPDASPKSGDRQLRFEGVPVRLRLVVVAPSGTGSEVDQEEVEKMLDGVVPGLGEIYKEDLPRLRIWPTQLSHEGFANQFHRNMIVPEPENEPTRWVLVAGRARAGKRQIMLGLALQAVKPTTIARQFIDAHQWALLLKVRVKE
ncbi:MAG: hypothetical protein L0215_12040 [Gemmataceae bacterium]|nr:hypothetical protein [Gemmataceae bacterium]